MANEKGILYYTPINIYDIDGDISSYRCYFGRIIPFCHLRFVRMGLQRSRFRIQFLNGGLRNNPWGHLVDYLGIFLIGSTLHVNMRSYLKKEQEKKNIDELIME